MNCIKEFISNFEGPPSFPQLQTSQTDSTKMALDPEVKEAILNMPAARPPQGVAPNFVNPSDLVALTYGLASIFTALVTVSVAIRIFTKWKIVRSVVIEDCESLFRT